MTDNIITTEGAIGALKITTDNFILLHDYFATVLNVAKDLMEESEKMGTPLSREECAGRVLMVTMLEMEKYASEHEDFVQELLISKKMEEANKMRKSYSDTMYG